MSVTFPHSEGTGTRSQIGYRPQARIREDATCDHLIVGETVLTKTTWVDIDVRVSPIGVPSDARLVEHRAYSLCAAQSLRWWFLADVDERFYGYDRVETRLLEIKVETTYAVTIQGIIAGEGK